MNYKPLSKEFLINRGWCCNNNCINCPYKNKKMKITNQQLHEEMIDMKQDIRDIKIRLLDPDKGTISKVNKNTSFRKGSQKTLWSIWLVIIGILGKLIFWN